MFAQISQQSASFFPSAAARRGICLKPVGYQRRQAVFHSVIDGDPHFLNCRQGSSQRPGKLLVGLPGKRAGEQTLFAAAEGEYRSVIVEQATCPASSPIALTLTFQFAREADDVRHADDFVK